MIHLSTDLARIVGNDHADALRRSAGGTTGRQGIRRRLGHALVGAGERIAGERRGGDGLRPVPAVEHPCP